MAFWEFVDYITEDHKCPIMDWWGMQEGNVQSAFDILVKTLREIEDWEALEPRQHKVLSDKHAGMCELMFTINGVGKFRPLGLWQPEARQFIFFGACRKGRFFTIPRGAFDDAYDLIARFKEGKGGIREHV